MVLHVPARGLFILHGAVSMGTCYLSQVGCHAEYTVDVLNN